LLKIEKFKHHHHHFVECMKSVQLVIIFIDIDDVVGDSCRCGLVFYLQQSRNILSATVDFVATLVTVASATHLAWGI